MKPPLGTNQVHGDVLWVKSAGAPPMWTDVAVTDGSVTLVPRFIGRHSIPGMQPGRRVVAEGTPGLVHGELVMLIPAYSFEGAW